LSQTDKTIPSGFERVVPNSTAAIQTVFNDTGFLTEAKSAFSMMPGQRSSKDSRCRVVGMIPQDKESE
jgi:hypothetical protein